MQQPTMASNQAMSHGNDPHQHMGMHYQQQNPNSYQQPWGSQMG